MDFTLDALVTGGLLAILVAAIAVAICSGLIIRLIDWYRNKLK
jgi:hypothetical protein